MESERPGRKQNDLFWKMATLSCQDNGRQKYSHFNGANWVVESVKQILVLRSNANELCRGILKRKISINYCNRSLNLPVVVNKREIAAFYDAYFKKTQRCPSNNNTQTNIWWCRNCIRIKNPEKLCLFATTMALNGLLKW